MAAPQIAETDEEEEGSKPPDKELQEEVEEVLDDEPENEEDPEIEEVDLTEDDMAAGSSDLFTSTDDATTKTETGSDDEEESDGQDADDVLGDLGPGGEDLEDAINDGAARLSVVGLDDGDEKDDLQDEFNEVFSAFRLGYFGAQFADEYLFPDEDDQVDPAWGLLGAAIVSAALVIWLRPDGDELVGRAQEAVENLAGGVLD